MASWPGEEAAQAPPLVVWMLAAGLFLVVLGALMVGFSWYDAEFRRFNRARLDALAAAPPLALTVVALGDSRLRHATRDEAEMADLGRQAGVGDLRFLRIVYNAGAFGDFVPLLDRILEVRPDVVLIQLDFLFRARAWDRNFRLYLRNLMWSVTRGTPVFDDPWATQFDRPCRRDGQPDLFTDSRHFERFKIGVAQGFSLDPDAPAYARVMAFAEAARARGIRVAFVHLRSSSQLEALIHEGRDLRPDLLAKVAGDSRGADFWRFPAESAGDRDYCDFIHLTDEASRAFSRWLVRRLASS
ncbi:MAG TPA: hypothetical protein VEB64_17890 [Azospirillaceae bacterium]|nr:hypothetical protein [Azospirillaceae bacterium]